MVDYRYSEASKFKEIIPPAEVEKFCRQVCHVENNALMGLGFIETTHGYAFLESSPMPGWDYFFKEDNSKEKVCRAIMGMGK